MFNIRFLLLPPAIIVAMDPVSCLQAAPLPSAECCYTAMWLMTPPPLYTRLLKTHAACPLGGSSIYMNAFIQWWLKHQCNISLDSKIIEYRSIKAAIMDCFLERCYSILHPGVNGMAETSQQCCHIGNTL